MVLHKVVNVTAEQTSPEKLLDGSTSCVRRHIGNQYCSTFFKIKI